MELRGDITDESGLQPVFIRRPVEPELDFSVVSLVASQEKYDRLVQSFITHGFASGRSEFLAIDNRGENRLDGFSALRAVLPVVRGRYILLTHDDVELTGDGADELMSILRGLDRQDPKWMVAGNAGRRKSKRLICIDDPHGEFRDLTAPEKVDSLDENFLVLPRKGFPLQSVDLSGFHFFATDLCLQARVAGGTAYALPFLLRHHSGGYGWKSPAFANSRREMERKWSNAGCQGRLYTPSTVLYFGWQGAIARRVDFLKNAWRRRWRQIERRMSMQTTSATGTR